MEQKSINEKLYKWHRETFICASTPLLPANDQLSCSIKLWVMSFQQVLIIAIISHLCGLEIEENKCKGLKLELLDNIVERL